MRNRILVEINYRGSMDERESCVRQMLRRFNNRYVHLLAEGHTTTFVQSNQREGLWELHVDCRWREAEGIRRFAESCARSSGFAAGGELPGGLERTFDAMQDAYALSPC